MLYKEVDQPVSGREAFGQMSDAALLSQAAVLLLLGGQLRGDTEALRATAKEYGQFVEALPREDMVALGIPPLSSSPGRIDSQRVRDFLRSRYGIAVAPATPGRDEPPFRRDIFADLAAKHFREPPLRPPSI